MANTIQMKRSAATGTSAPTGLAKGELAWLNNGANGGNGKLYIGSSDDTPQMLHIAGLGTGAVSASVVADDIGTGDGAVTLATSAGNITLDAQGNDTDIIFKGTDGSSDTTFLTLDGSAAGAATFNSSITCATSLTIGSAAMSEADLEQLDGITAGTVAASKAVVVDSNKDAASFRNVTLTGTLTAADLDIGSDVDIDGTLEADAMTLNGTAITTTATLSTGISNGNVLVANNAVADNDFLRVDGTSIEGRTAAETLSDISAAPAAGSSNIVTTGALNSGSISSGFGNIDNGSSTFNTGAATVDSLSVSDGNITNVADIALDSISADGTDINVALDDNSATALTIKQGSDAYLIVDTANSSESVSIGTGISGTAITIGHGTSETTVGDNLTVTGNLTVSGTTTTVDSTTVSIADPIFELGASGSDDNLDRGIKMKYNSGGAKVAFMGFDDSTGKFTMIPDATDSSSTFSGTAGTLVMSTFEGNLTGNVTGNASGTAATVTGGTQASITTVANVVEVGALDAGSITSGFGNINNGSSTITTTGLISGGSLDIDNVLINGTTIGHTDDTDLMTVADGLLTVAGEISVTTLDIGGTNVTSTAAELNILDGVTASATDINLIDGITNGTVIASKAIITDSNKDISGGRNITISGELDAATGDFSGNVDVGGTFSIAGTNVTSTAAELNILDGVTSTASELNLVDGITAGTISASKAVIVDSNKDITGFRNLTITGALDGATIDGGTF